MMVLFLAKLQNITHTLSLFLFGVGDHFIHELTVNVEGLPKSHLFKQCRNPAFTSGRRAQNS